MFLNNVKCEHNNNKFPLIAGELIMTNYKLVFKRYSKESEDASPKKTPLVLPSYLDEYLSVPLSYIYKIEKTTLDKKIPKINFLEIYTKDHRYLKFSFDNQDECHQTLLRIQVFAFPDDEMLKLFSMEYFYPEVHPEDLFENGWDIFKSPDHEFERMGIDFTSKVTILSLILCARILRLNYSITMAMKCALPTLTCTLSLPRWKSQK